ncbi:hypothetical protein ANN_09352 [Periplaneta americana]|uniref:Uncharacterized protein n=1 Tax=Periplaneta americana TaxID=6978 RepID=A0ABQ8TNL9_PERAM|nr:hypothetical protein ANN_09352 [Periplaneta americana]
MFRAVASWSKASCLGLALRTARWFESSWGKKFAHEISASVWDRLDIGSYNELCVVRNHILYLLTGGTGDIRWDAGVRSETTVSSRTTGAYGLTVVKPGFVLIPRHECSIADRLIYVEESQEYRIKMNR